MAFVNGNEVVLNKHKVQEYIKNGGRECPFCGSGKMIGGPIEKDGYTEAHRNCHCSDCKGEWIEAFEVTHLT